MDVSDLLRAVFYLWLFVALAYWAYRGYKRVVRGGSDDLAERATIDSTTDGRTTGSATTATGRRTMRQVLDDQQAAKKAEPEVQPGQLVSSVIKEELASRRAQEQGDQEDQGDQRDRGDQASQPPAGAGAAEHGGASSSDEGGSSVRRGLFAPVSTEPDPAPAPTPAVSTLLEGIAMPCDLVPLITADLSPSPHHVVFVTTGHAPAQVGSSVGDELERLGFALRSESDTELVATRAADTLRVTLHPDAPTARAGGDLLFPSVPGGSVAVEFRS